MGPNIGPAWGVPSARRAKNWGTPSALGAPNWGTPSALGVTGSWDAFGSVLELLGVVLGLSWGRPGSVLGASWGVLERHVGVSRASWKYLVPDFQSKGC